MTQFKVGDRIKRVAEGLDCAPLGFETTVTGVLDSRTIWYESLKEGKLNGKASNWALVEQPSGPVVTETVTKTRIVPGTYSHLNVGYSTPTHVSVGIGIDGRMWTPDDLDAAAAVLSALAKGLRDV